MYLICYDYLVSNKSLVIIVFLIFALTASLFLVLRTTVFFGKAAFTNTNSIAYENSYLFASPLQAKADGKEQLRVTVFILDGRGIGIPNISVSLLPQSALTVKDTQAVTDDSGKAVFDISSLTKGTFNLQARADNHSIPQQVKIAFY